MSISAAECICTVRCEYGTHNNIEIRKATQAEVTGCSGLGEQSATGRYRTSTGTSRDSDK
eukprot:scaffold27922_cov32-Prasinocladus_malaysianus.AAC.1